MRNHTCLLDHHQRSHYDTITIGPEGKFYWVPQLINGQKVKLFDSLEEKFNTQRSSNKPNQSQNPIRDRSGQPEDMQDVFVVKGEKSRSHEITGRKVFTKNSVLQTDQGNLRSRLA